MGAGCSKDPYQQFNVGGFSGPTCTAGGSIGNESGVNLLSGCADHTVDLALSRTIRVGGKRSLQFRLDMFNAFNALVFKIRCVRPRFSGTARLSATVLNSQLNTDGSLDMARLTTTSAGAGAATGAQAMRKVPHMSSRFQFDFRRASRDDRA